MSAARTQPSTLSVEHLDRLIQNIIKEAPPLLHKHEAVCVVLHSMMLHEGFKCVGANATEAETQSFSTNSDFLPVLWNANASEGLYSFYYTHSNGGDSKYILKCLHMATKLTVHVSESKSNKVYSIELSLPDHINEGAQIDDFLGILRNLPGLCSLFSKELMSKIIPATPRVERLHPSYPSSSHDDRQSSQGEHHGGILPEVGRGDLFPSGLGGEFGEGGGMEVGPNHPLFGGIRDLGRGQIPGARFDPFGPVVPSRPPPFSSRLPQRTPPVFGEPDSDHLRMPRFGGGGGGGCGDDDAFF